MVLNDEDHDDGDEQNSVVEKKKWKQLLQAKKNSKTSIYS